MPSGKTHDSITLWSLPLVAGLTFGYTQSASLTLVLSGSYLFSGLMFGPDLDVYSQQYKRWGIIRWIWLPYRQSMRHRAFLSHGPGIGTVVRVVYLLSWIALFIGLMVAISAIAYAATGELQRWQQTSLPIWQTAQAAAIQALQRFLPEWIAGAIGLELGALSHSLSDWVGSAYKRQQKRRRPRRPSSARSSESPTSQPPPSSPLSGSLPAAKPTVELPILPSDSQIRDR